MDTKTAHDPSYQKQESNTGGKKLAQFRWAESISRHLSSERIASSKSPSSLNNMPCHSNALVFMGSFCKAISKSFKMLLGQQCGGYPDTHRNAASLTRPLLCWRTKVLIASRRDGAVAIIERSRIPDIAMFKVLGIGVAVSVRMSTSALSAFNFSFCLTPKRCSSSIMAATEDFP